MVMLANRLKKKTPEHYEPKTSIRSTSERDSVDSLLTLLQGAYANSTINAYRSDFKIFMIWCGMNKTPPLPTTSEIITRYIEYEMNIYSAATIRRHIASISRIHRLAELPDPSVSETVRLALRRMHRQIGRRQKQALGLTSDLRDKLIEATCPNEIYGYRDRLLVSIAYDTLRRSSELVSLRFSDIQPTNQNGGIILVRRSKSDQEGEGKLAYLSARTLGYCEDWKEKASLNDGLILRRVFKNGNIGASLYSGSVSRIFKRLARASGLPEEIVSGLSGHSARVGAAQDMAAAGIDLISIMQAGGWKSPEIVARYIENLDVMRGGSFRLAMQQQSSSK